MFDILSEFEPRATETGNGLVLEEPMERKGVASTRFFRRPLDGVSLWSGRRPEGPRRATDRSGRRQSYALRPLLHAAPTAAGRHFGPRQAAAPGNGGRPLAGGDVAVGPADQPPGRKRRPPSGGARERRPRGGAAAGPVRSARSERSAVSCVKHGRRRWPGRVDGLLKRPRSSRIGCLLVRCVSSAAEFPRFTVRRRRVAPFGSSLPATVLAVDIWRWFIYTRARPGGASSDTKRRRPSRQLLGGRSATRFFRFHRGVGPIFPTLGGALMALAVGGRWAALASAADMFKTNRPLLMAQVVHLKVQIVGRCRTTSGPGTGRNLLFSASFSSSPFSIPSLRTVRPASVASDSCSLAFVRQPIMCGRAAWNWAPFAASSASA